MFFRYSAFGLQIHSNTEIPGLKPENNFVFVPDFVLRLGYRPDLGDPAGGSSDRLVYVSSMNDEAGQPALKIWETNGSGFFHLVYCDGTQFWLDRAGTKLWATWEANCSIETTALYLMGPVMALVLRLRGVICLHASAVIVEGRAVAFVGPEEAGKSTIAATFAQRGFLILSDDIVPLVEKGEEFFAQPGSAHLRLWPESVEMLFGGRQALRPLLPGWEKRRLSEGDHNSRFTSEPAPLAAIYTLGARSADDSAPCIEGLSQQTALINLVANSYATQLIDPKMRGEELEFFGRLVSRVPVRQLTAHAEARRLDELSEVVCGDFASLGWKGMHPR